MLLAAKVLLTLATLGYSAIPAFFDSNSTHVTNPSFPGHARFHVVWQVSSYVYVAVLALYLIWTAREDVWPLWISVFLAGCAYLGFWTAVASRSVYEGKLVSEVNPVPNFKWKLFGTTVQTDANVTLFAAAALVLIAAIWALASA